MGDKRSDARVDVEKLRHRDPGETDADVYEDVDTSLLPPWWRRAIEEFKEYGLRPYRPPRFGDGAMKHAVVNRLETRNDVAVRFIGRDVSYGDDWEVYVDGDRIGTVGRHRSPHGYTVFEIESDEFVSWVERNLPAEDG